MSWKQFEKEVVEKLETEGFKNPDDFAKFFTNKYDECVKRGVDLVTFNTVLKGNKDFMYSMIQIANLVSIAATTPALYDLYFNMLGDAVVGYWSGAKLTTFFTPIIPAPGTIMNIGVTDNSVINPGIWVKSKVPPMKSVRVFVKTFVSYAKIHLATVQGLCSTISLYPPLSTPGPAMLQWQGFKVVEPKTKYTNNPADSYEAPIDGAKVNFTFDKGIEISVTKVNDNWSFVKDTNSKSGFIKKEFITDKKP
jgi:hypothetical protein